MRESRMDKVIDWVVTLFGILSWGLMLLGVLIIYGLVLAFGWLLTLWVYVLKVGKVWYCKTKNQGA